MGEKRQIKARDVVQDIYLGIPDTELMKKYKVSQEQVHLLRRQVMEEAASRCQRIIEDVRSGMTNSQLMERHLVSDEQLQRILLMLARRGSITPEELRRGASQHEAAADSNGNRRKTPRNYPILSVKVYEDKNPDMVGFLSDVTDKGIGVAGLHAKVGEITTLVIVEDECDVVEHCKFQAACRWVSKVALTGEYLAGFEIKNISQQALEDLRKLIRTGTFQREDLEMPA